MNDQQMQQEQKPKNSKKWIWIIGGIIVLVIIFASIGGEEGTNNNQTGAVNKNANTKSTQANNENTQLTNTEVTNTGASNVNQQSEEKFGLSEAQRRAYYKELVAVEDRANDEAEEMYPIDIMDPAYSPDNIELYIDYSGELMDEYKADLRDEYGITEDIEDKIIAEAFEEDWPLH